jgi:hypothetical protein
MKTTNKNRKTKKPTKKPTQYHYFFDFKSGDYFDITRSIECQYPSEFLGCGMGLGGFDVHLRCTSRQFDNIRRWVVRNFRNRFKVKRYTEQELYADD